MKTTSFYFRHDYNSHNDEKILMLRSEHGTEAYGVFWMILETMAMSSTGEINREAIGGLSLGYGVAKGRLSEIIDYCVRIGLFKKSHNGAIISTRMKSHLAERQVLKDAGRRGAEKRWKISQKNSPPNSQGEERRGEERKENNNVYICDEFEDFVRWLNNKNILKGEKSVSVEGHRKWNIRRKVYSAEKIAAAFENLLNEPDKWKIENNGHRSLVWWLHSDERIEEMLNCHLKGRHGSVLIAN